MGSGHFLVEVTEYIARRLVEADLLPPPLRAGPNPPSAIPLGKGELGSPVDELAYWKRRVAQSCVYGVDLNPLAVDLAKLSLWLITAAQDRPLSFLDHHLPLANHAIDRRQAVPPEFDLWLAGADVLAQRWRFFHWELEFPEVFFDRHGQSLGTRAGSDGVIGNPPYVRQEDLGPLKPYLEAAYPGTHHGMADLFVCFFNRGLRLTRAGGRMSYIATNKWLRAGYGEPLRAYFAAEGALEQIVDFGHAPIFPDADVFPCIIVLEKPAPDAGHGATPEREVQVTVFPRDPLGKVELDRYVREHGHCVPQGRFTWAVWSLEPAAVNDLLAKIKRAGVPLAEFAGVKPYYGVKTGLNEAFLIDTPTSERLVKADPRCAEIIKPYLRGQDMTR